MARSGALGGGTLNPFGSATTDFGAFNIGESAASKTVSAQEQASLAFAVTRAQHDNGLISDDNYAAAYATYSAGLDMKTQAGATAQYDLAMMQYTNDRNELAQQVQAGQRTWEDLMAFDAAAISQTVPGSTEYMQRQDRYWSSQANVFQGKEAEMLDQLQHDRITNQQAQDWYNEQVGAYGDNYQIISDIHTKIGTFADRIVAAADQDFAAAWNKGTLTMAQVVAYTQKAQRDDPGSGRAKQLVEFAQGARLQAEESSMKYRYDLTREAVDLQKLIASNAGKAPTSKVSTSSSTREIYDGTKWVYVTSTSSKVTGPTAKQVEANKARLQQIADAKKRLAEITSVVGKIAGGWVTDQDYIRNLSQQQALVKSGTPEWYALQKQIDGHTQRIAADKALTAAGVKIAFPAVKSELAVDLEHPVGSSERAVGVKLTSKQLAQAAGWQNAIAVAQEGIAGGNLTDEQKAQYQTIIDTNSAYISNMLHDQQKATAAAAKTAAPKVTTGGGTVAARVGTGAVSAARSTSTGTAKTGVGTLTKGALQVITGQAYSSPYDNSAVRGRMYEGTSKPPAGTPMVVRTVQTTPTGLPKNMTPTAFDDMHHEFIDAIKNGDASFVDKTTKTAYLIPLDPAKRLEMVRYLDDQNVDMKVATLRHLSTTPGVSKEKIDKASSAVTTAQRNAVSNRLWILDTSNPGTTFDSDGKAIKLGAPEGSRNQTNVLAYALDLVDVTTKHAQTQFDLAQEAFDQGNYTGAAAYTAKGKAIIDHIAVGPSGTPKDSLLASYVNKAGNELAVANAVGAKVPPKYQSDLDKLTGFPETFSKTAKDADKIATTLFDPKAGILKMQNGVLVTDVSGQVVFKDGWGAVVDSKGKVVPAETTVQRYDENGKPVWGIDGYVNVLYKTGGASVPVLAKPTVNVVGSVKVDGNTIPIMGKIVTVNGEAWTENPFRAGEYVPGGGVTFTVPKGTTAIPNPGGGKKNGISGVPVGNTLFLFTKDGHQYVMSADKATGQYNLWMGDAAAKNFVPAGSSLTATGDRDQNFANITSGFGYDHSSLTAPQKQAVDLVDYKINPTGGAFIGASSADLVNYFLRPHNGLPVEWAGDTLSEKAVMASPSTYAPQTVPYAPASEPIPVSPYTGSGYAYTPTKITAPPKVAPITTVTSSTGVKKTVSTGKVATPVGKPAIYDTNPTPVVKTPIVKPNVSFVTKPAPVPSGEKATVIPKSGPVAK